MTAEYILEQRVLGPRLQMTITEERYLALAHAGEVLSQALTFEQRYELLLGNFISLELAFTEISLRAKLEPQYGYSDSAAILERANRHVVNVLTAMRGYADQVQQDFKCLDLEPRFGLVAKCELTKVFERSSAYRFIYSLRNHVQHRATAIDGFEGEVDPKGDANAWVDTVRLYANKSSLKADKDFKKRTLDEQPDKIDVRRAIRQSMQVMGEAHLALRKVVSEHVERARATAEAAIRDYKAAGAESVIGLCARRLGNADADVAVLLDWDDVRLQLVRKNAAGPQLLPRRTHREPKPEEVVAMRQQAKQTCAQAAAAVFVAEERWRDFEEGLPMPQGLFELYMLQVERHPTHYVQVLNVGDEQDQPTA